MGDEPARASTSGLPILDISPILGCYDGMVDFLSPDVTKLGSALREICIEHGFFYIKSSSTTAPLLSDDVLDSAVSATKEFFALPPEEKNRFNACNSDLWRGYQSEETGQHSCDPGASKREGKESFTIGMEKGPVCPMIGPNQWASASMKKCMQSYTKALLRIARALMIGLSSALGLPKGFFLEKSTDPVAQLVLLRYPPKMDGTVGCGAHTDCGFLTLLWQSDSGLQVKRSRADGWIDAPPIKGTFVVNLGDMVQFWTGGLFKSTQHRVNSSSKSTRYSMPFFCNTNYHAMVRTIPGCTMEGEEEGEKHSIMAGRYLMEKLGLMHE